MRKIVPIVIFIVILIVGLMIGLLVGKITSNPTSTNNNSDVYESSEVSINHRQPTLEQLKTCILPSGHELTMRPAGTVTDTDTVNTRIQIDNTWHDLNDPSTITLADVLLIHDREGYLNDLIKSASFLDLNYVTVNEVVAILEPGDQGYVIEKDGKSILRFACWINS